MSKFKTGSSVLLDSVCFDNIVVPPYWFSNTMWGCPSTVLGYTLHTASVCLPATTYTSVVSSISYSRDLFMCSQQPGIVYETPSVCTLRV